ncbi:MAG: 50S ribosomal protein L4 [Candidatus Omnitrophica bacterium]|nr:50S ribosomal protein L4 [Candidatus Omnitrophota bacterium]
MSSEEKNYLVVYDAEGKENEKIHLDPGIFDGKVNTELLYQVKLMYEARQRQGTASTKTRGEVRGGGKKPWRQKGTGRARMGSIRSPLWRGGGKVFGPKPRDYAYRLPRKTLVKALQSSLNLRWGEDNLRLISEEINLEKPKTKNFQQILKGLHLKGKVLFIFKEIKPEIKITSRNIPGVTVKAAREVNALDILYNDKVVLTPSALSGLMERVRNET